MPTKIEWTEETWNPLTGCTRIGQGCKHCYAERMAARLRAMGKKAYQDAVDDKGHWTGKITLLHEKIESPLSVKKPTMFFVNSMSDLFHKNVPQDFIEGVFDTMRKANWHKFQVLTKRYERAADVLADIQPAPHIQIGFSVCNQPDAAASWQHLGDISALDWVTFVSYEPALESINWNGWEFLDWMICGGESGPGCRPFDVEWAYRAMYFCRDRNIPFFMKQLGGHPRKRDKLEDLPEDLRIRELPR